MPIRTLKHGVVTFATAAGTKSVALAPGPGNFTISEVKAGNCAAIPIQNRGVHHEWGIGPEEPVEFSITILHDTTLTNASAVRVWDAILGTGYYSGETTADAGAVVWTGNITLVVTRAGSVDTHTFRNVHLKAGYSENEAGNEITISGTAVGNGTGNAYSVTSA